MLANQTTDKIVLSLKLQFMRVEIGQYLNSEFKTSANQ